MKWKLKIAALFVLAMPIMAQHRVPEPTMDDNGKWCCPKPYWPFQSWTHLWSCVKGKTEAQSTWYIYEDSLFFTKYHDWKVVVPDPETSWFLNVRYENYQCESIKRKDGLVHSVIMEHEYTQTCTDGKLGLLVPVL